MNLLSFKKKLHEPARMQLADLKDELVGDRAAAGESCDRVSGASGPFGHTYSNPIPVNGQGGTFKYFRKLRAPSGGPVFFHRLGCQATERVSCPVDVYEVMDHCARFWDILFVDMYHPRRSNDVPQGYTLKPYDRATGDLAPAFGVDIFCPRFPCDLGDAIEHHDGWPACARQVRAAVESYYSGRPHDQQLRVDDITPRLSSTQGWCSAGQALILFLKPERPMSPSS